MPSWRKLTPNCNYFPFLTWDTNHPVCQEQPSTVMPVFAWCGMIFHCRFIMSLTSVTGILTFSHMWELILWMQSSFITVISSEAVVRSFYNEVYNKDRFWTGESMQIYLKSEVYSQDCLLLVISGFFSFFFLPLFFNGVLSNLKYNIIREAWGLCSRVAFDCLLWTH